MTTLDTLPVFRDCTSHRASSYDVSGGNADAWTIAPGERRVLADIEGAGCVRHIWMTLAMPDDDYLRRIVLRCTWDDASEPSVEVPIGDFFGMGHAKRKNFVTAPLQMSPAGGTGFNSWWPMPFRKGARIEVENQGDQAYTNYFYIDYEKYADPSALAGQGYFHCQWKREPDTRGWAHEEGIPLAEAWSCPRGKNLSGKDNYVILDAEGDGIYCGAHLDIDCFQRNPNDWYGEGDDMTFIDGEELPSINGTGTEDWYHCSWCPREEYQAPYHGIILTGGTDEWPWKGKHTVYRYHIEDPLRFRKSIRVTIEHGHANKLSNDYSSTAYYYLSEPKKGGPNLPPVGERLPRPDA